MSGLSSNRIYYPLLDGLRGVAITMVLLHHNFGYNSILYMGWLGVDLFFVLSGFLITDILLNSLNEPHYLSKFYMHRVLRILPLYYAFLIISFFALPLINSFHENINYYKDNQLWLWLYCQNWLFIFHSPYGSNMFLHFWSLAVEEQFYLVWPFIILLIRKPKQLLYILACVLILLFVIRLSLWNYEMENFPYASFYSYSRFDGICIGSIIAISFRSKEKYFKKIK